MGWRFRIAGFRFEISPEHSALRSLAEDWREFSTQDEPDCKIEVELTAPVERPPSWQLALPEVIGTAAGGIRVLGDGFQADIPGHRRTARIRQAPERFGLEAVIRILLADFLLAAGGLLLHSVGIASRDRACVFVGPSGAGKSTLAKLCRESGMVCLSDELVAVLPSEGKFLAFGTPWNVGVSVASELRILGLLTHAPRATLDFQPEGELVRALLPNSLMPDPTPDGRARMFRAASQLISGTRTVRLNFARDRQVASVLVSELAA